VGRETPEVERITADPDWYEPYRISLGLRVGNLLFISGQASSTEDGELVGAGDFDVQAEQVFSNLSKVLENGGASLADVVKVTIFLTDMGNLGRVVELRERYFTPPYPADTIVEVSALARPEWLIEIEAIAIVSSRIPRRARVSGRSRQGRGEE
jgi:reactive intermediate/imine deaminase